ncbi:EthD family reductase [Salinisphaera sp. P385]|uniref:EthD family reductase n=1 Tax=Spectribacter acetivorans TaxID=3075603 RepID=A0ABU3B6R4_9GAMM|nr:EthD family reductase [Salinisphaera sp. P385]MDT0616993.1 EthD family reductase [Salinisphaera sp. P385]
MIRVSAVYPHTEGARFDHDYYRNHHMALVRDRLGVRGMVRAENDKGLAGGDGGPPPFVAAAHLYFESIQDFQSAFDAEGDTILADIPNYTDIQPQLQIAEIVDGG